QKEAITMSNSIAVMNNGIVEQIGDAGEIYENPRTVFVANFIGETNLFDGTVSSNGNGAATVDCAGLAVKVSADGPVTDGQRASVSVRPEKIRIGPGLDSLANCYDGVVEDVIYQGSTTSYRVRVGGGRDVNVAVQNTERSDGFAPGAAIKVGWEPERGVLIPEHAP
ncbi:MAG: TOBE domain-containing protein, partial [Minwuiales bacterium]|nr:TOBE domain-containing protein [Minwuiales bacterium]